MKKLTISMVACVAALIAAAFATQPQPAQADGFEWITDYKEGLVQATAEKKPIFLVFR